MRGAPRPTILVLSLGMVGLSSCVGRVGAEMMGMKCSKWCVCHAQLAWFQELLADQDKVWPMEDLKVIEGMAYVNLCCLARRSPDWVMRMYANAQLVHPVWRYQKSL